MQQIRLNLFYPIILRNNFMKSEIHSKKYPFGNIKKFFLCYLEIMPHVCSCVYWFSVKVCGTIIVDLFFLGFKLVLSLKHLFEKIPKTDIGNVYNSLMVAIERRVSLWYTQCVHLDGAGFYLDILQIRPIEFEAISFFRQVYSSQLLQHHSLLRQLHFLLVMWSWCLSFCFPKSAFPPIGREVAT